MQRRTSISGGVTTRRSLGITLALTSAILFSTAGIFTKSVAADALSVIFWRGIFGGVAGLTLLFITRRFWHELAAMRGAGVDNTSLDLLREALLEACLPFG